MYKITIIMQLKHVIEKIYTHSNVMNALNYGFKNVVLQKGKIFVKKNNSDNEQARFHLK